jgi:hypothetical protein
MQPPSLEVQIMSMDDIRQAHGLATLAILQMCDAAKARMTPEQLGEMENRLNSGTGRLVLVVSNDGAQLHAELGLIDAKAPHETFTNALLRLDGPLVAAVASADAVTVTNRGAMN